jgi:hypothetical protein
MIIYPFEVMWNDISKYIRNKYNKQHTKNYTSPQIKTCKPQNIKYIIQRNESTEHFMKLESPWIL